MTCTYDGHTKHWPVITDYLLNSNVLIYPAFSDTIIIMVKNDEKIRSKSKPEFNAMGLKL